MANRTACDFFNEDLGVVILRQKININELFEEMVIPKKPIYRNWKEYFWCCFLCAHRSDNYNSLRFHLSKNHLVVSDEDVRYQCDDCCEIIDDYANFLNHLRKHHELLRMCCDICSEHFKLSNDLSNHRNQLHLKCNGITYPDIIYCTKCELCFSNTTEFAKHYKTHNIPHIAWSKEFENHLNFLRCNICLKVFCTSEQLEAHKRIHEPRKQYVKKIMINISNISEEKIPIEKQKSIPDINVHLYQCKQCLTKFMTPISLNAHMRIHLSQEEYKCKHCSQIFQTAVQLKLHDRTHTGSARIKCGKCSKVFANRLSLVRHSMRTCLVSKWSK